jgi:hypothetical protein
MHFIAGYLGRIWNTLAIGEIHAGIIIITVRVLITSI